MKKRILSIVLTMALIISGMMLPEKRVEAASSHFFVGALGYIEPEIISIDGGTDDMIESMGGTRYYPTETVFPSSFDLRTLNLITPVKNQNPYGTCWTFAACASLESNALMLGYPLTKNLRKNDKG